ncbi:hypothetical protein DFS34DRAFT_602539 [Phlyctochytrium arcticum]|nr:hypothetical protein DFS34DRAFT_602539 [Phlyctochytrium arcticum]
MTLQVSDYLDTYMQLCQERNVVVIDSFRRSLQHAVEGGPVPEQFKLSGDQPELRKQRLSDAYVDVLLAPLSASGPFLRDLDLSCNAIGDAGASVLARFLEDDMQLEALDLHANNIGPEGISAIARALQVNEKLQRLDISDNSLKEEGGMEIANMLQINSTLLNIQLRNTDLTAKPLIALSTVLRNNTTLCVLNISNNHPYTTQLSQSLADDVMMHITRMIKLNYTLREVSVSKMGVSDWQVTEYWAQSLKTNLRMTSVDLSCNRISRDGGVAICKSLYNHPSLTFLKLSCCAIQDEGAEAVSDMLKNNFALQTLHLDHNQITGQGLVAISTAFPKNFVLKQICLWGNKWDVPACEAWATLIGGAAASVAIGDDLSGAIVKVSEIFPKDGRRTISLRAQSARDRDGGRLHPGPYVDPRAGQRFKEADVDFSIYSIEGVLNVSRNS